MPMKLFPTSRFRRVMFRNRHRLYRSSRQCCDFRRLPLEAGTSSLTLSISTPSDTAKTKKPRHPIKNGGRSDCCYLTAYTTAPSTTATSVVAMSRVLEEKRQFIQATAASNAANGISNQ